MNDGRPESRSDRERLAVFTKALLEDLRALERMLDEGHIESGRRRIGAEQELFLVDRAMRPAMLALEILDRLQHPQVTTELGLFNLEFNLTPQEFGDDCLRRMEREIENLLAVVRNAAADSGARVLLTGILPTLRKKHLTLDAMTPQPRYRDLNDATVRHRGGEFRLLIKGLDELNVSHDNVLCEACATSFQVHFQCGHHEFAKLYNLAQAVTAPVLAAAANSPVFLQHRLWHETRMALFQQAVDSRSDAHQARQAPPRVSFGNRWVDRSVVEIFKEDIARFRVFLSSDPGGSSVAALDRGEIPELLALRQHNGTVYRWNRPCYGVRDGRPHLRIEHRTLPAGPTVIDEVANASFFFGLLSGLGEEYDDITKRMSFDDAKSNFIAAARYGLQARFQWIGGRTTAADRLILDELLPIARQGLLHRGVRAEDVDRYLDVMEGRVRAGRTGAQWVLDSLSAFGDAGKPEARFGAVTSCMYARQVEGRPVHEWKLARIGESSDWRDSVRTVEQIMTTDLFTVRPDDPIDLVASLMDWEQIRHVPVEDESGTLVGLVSYRHLLRLVGRGLHRDDSTTAVRDVMIRDPVAVDPATSTLAAIATMRKHRVSCLLVTDPSHRLVGIVTERDFIQVTAKLLDEKLRERYGD